MAKEKMMGLMLNGTLKQSGVTFYHRNGQLIARTAHSTERRSNTRGQFVARMRMKHTVALWKSMNHLDLMFGGGKSKYAVFASLANRLPAVFIPNSGKYVGAAMLMPGIPVSNGSMTTVDQRLDTVNGTPALVTNLKKSGMQRKDGLVLYTMVQNVKGGKPSLSVNARKVLMSEVVVVDGCVALCGDEFADTMRGWALVLVNEDRCSTQCIVTNCNYYEQFTTEEAFKTAAESYGGLTKEK
jgi:hypothetical protein